MVTGQVNVPAPPRPQRPAVDSPARQRASSTPPEHHDDAIQTAGTTAAAVTLTERTTARRRCHGQSTVSNAASFSAVTRVETTLGKHTPGLRQASPVQTWSKLSFLLVSTRANSSRIRSTFSEGDRSSRPRLDKKCYTRPNHPITNTQSSDAHVQAQTCSRQQCKPRRRVLAQLTSSSPLDIVFPVACGR